MEVIESNIFYCLLVDDKCRAIISRINENIFINKEYFRKIKELCKKNEFDIVKMLTYNNELTSKIMNENITTSNFENEVIELTNMYNKRVLANKLQTALKKIGDDEPIEEIIGYIKKDNELIVNSNNINSSSEIAIKTLDYIEKYAKTPKLNTGIRPLDNLLGGIQKGNLVIISARTGCGKTTFALQTALNMAKKGNRALFISLEMAVEELGIKIYSTLAKIDSKTILKNTDTKAMLKIGEQTSKLREYNIMIDDKTQYIEDIVANIRLLKAKNKIDVVFIDYVGLIKSREKAFSRENEIAKISRELKLIAKECNVAIILLAQLNRLAENQEPSLSMLRESGALEMDSNKVIFLWQEIEEQDKQVGKLNIKVAKNREGLKGKIEVGFNKSIGLIAEIAKEEAKPYENNVKK